MLSVKAIVVLYNKGVADSASIKSILKQLEWKGLVNFSLSIYDNSENPMIDEGELSELNKVLDVNYVHDKSNRGLNVIYAGEFNKFETDYLLLLDDDTSLPVNYLSGFISAQKKFGFLNVFVPRIYTFNRVISPYKTCLFLSKSIGDCHPGIYRNIHAINSGVLLPNISEIKNYNYPQYVKFYGTDTVLFDYLNKLNIPIVVMASNVNHDLSFHPQSDSEKYQNALRNVVSFWRSHYANNLIYMLLLFCYLFYLSFKMSIKTKKIINLFNVK